MNITDKIFSLKKSTKAKIEHALKNNNTEIIVLAAKDLELLEHLERQYNEIKTAIDSLSQKGSFNLEKLLSINKSPKQIGKEQRDTFVKKAKDKGISLSKENGQLYRKKSGGLVGIAYASERIHNHWWLGLPIKKYCSLVFICKNDRLRTTYFIFPKAFCERYKFSTDKKEKQFKFNVSLKDSLFTFKMPDSEPIAINEYIDKFDNMEK